MEIQASALTEYGSDSGWSGCYAGGAAGLGTGHVSWRDVSTPGDIDAKGAFNIAESDMSGSVFGAKIGCD